MSENCNWVERRVAREQSLSNDKGTVWKEVRSAVDDACTSYRNHYGTREPYVNDASLDGLQIRIQLPRQLLKGRPTATGGGAVISDITVSFNSQTPAIEWADHRGGHELTISSDENNAFVVEGATRLSADEVSRRILEPVLFPGT
jgi:hypothetical protein